MPSPSVELASSLESLECIPRVPRPDSVELIPRHLHINKSLAQCPRYWWNNNAYLTLYSNSMSMLFPAGERFFISAVKDTLRTTAVSKCISPRLARDISAFVGQEAIHTLEHEDLNAVVAQCGYNVPAMLAVVEFILTYVPFICPPPWRSQARLATTIGLEHLTACFGYTFLTDSRLPDVDPSVRPLWIWHAIEELEHKAVAFDVYDAAYSTSITFQPSAADRAAEVMARASASQEQTSTSESPTSRGAVAVITHGPLGRAVRAIYRVTVGPVVRCVRAVVARRLRARGYVFRVFWFLVSTGLLLLVSQTFTTYMMLKDRQLHPRTWIRGMWDVYGPNGFLVRSAGDWVQFLRPSYHPWQSRRDEQLLAEWYPKMPEVERKAEAEGAR
eukprot:TRINITY_DN21430_c0_g1_i1.p1 TRINITY_DN21430_c0_g1~~TRINITY_DN21430_c0_g1_i1.p1  ORF type:complete len:408 (-),score=49.35 TRINITY_DN21430_c0_g1_i1:295-1458(-)